MKIFMTIMIGILLGIIVGVAISQAGERLQIGGSGHLLDKGECMGSVCVIDEVQAGTNGYLYQICDWDDDQECDFIVVWKPLDDPTYGRQWQFVKQIGCEEALR